MKLLDSKNDDVSSNDGEFEDTATSSFVKRAFVLGDGGGVCLR